MRIILTDTCRDFCNKNDSMSQGVMMKMFEGIPEKDINTTIQTIIAIEKNLRGAI